MLQVVALLMAAFAPTDAELKLEAAYLTKATTAAGQCAAFGYDIQMPPLLEMSEVYAQRAALAGWTAERAQLVLAEAADAQGDMFEMEPPAPDATNEEVGAIAMAMRDQTISVCEELASKHPEVIPDPAAGRAKIMEMFRHLTEPASQALAGHLGNGR